MTGRSSGLALGPAVPTPAPRGDSGSRPRELLEIGRSTEGRPILAYLSGPPRAELAIAVLAGQHGDEPWARDAARRWLAEIADHEPECGPDASVARLAVVPDANPDGAAEGRRRNARGIDLNRDHLELASVEARAIHTFVSAFRPDLVVDLHNYPPRRRHLVARGLSIDADVQVGFPTHPAVRTALGSVETAALEEELRSEMARSGFRSARYTLFQESGRARPGSQQVGDARNGLALRFGVPTVLLEGRDPGRRGTESDAERTVRAQQLALACVVRWSLRHGRLLARGPPVPSSGETVPIAARWEASPQPRAFVFRRATSDRRLVVPWSDHVEGVRVVRSAVLPRAYAVRGDAVDLRAALERHEVDGELARGPRPALVEAPVAEARIAAHPRRVLDLDGYVVYSVHQRAGRALAVWLEPRSRYRLHRSVSPGSSPTEAERPEVVRVLLHDYPPVVGVRAGLPARTEAGGRPSGPRAGEAPVPSPAGPPPPLGPPPWRPTGDRTPRRERS